METCFECSYVSKGGFILLFSYVLQFERSWIEGAYVSIHMSLWVQSDWGNVQRSYGTFVVLKNVVSVAFPADLI